MKYGTIELNNFHGFDEFKTSTGNFDDLDDFLLIIYTVMLSLGFVMVGGR